MLLEPAVGAPGVGIVARSSVESISTLQLERRLQGQKRDMIQPVARAKQGSLRSTTVVAGIIAIAVAGGN